MWKVILGLMIFSSAAFAEGTSLLELRGHSLKLKQFTFNGKSQLAGDCDSKAIETGAFWNSISFGESSPVLFSDDIVCPKSATFNAVFVLPASIDQQREKQIRLVLAIWSGKIPGLFSKEKSTFQIDSKEFDDNVNCTLTKTSSWKLMSIFGELTCKITEGNEITFDVI